jgi:hypothetical protein
MTITRRISKFIPVALAFGLVAAGSWTLLPNTDSAADAEAATSVLVLTKALPAGTSASDVSRWVSERELPPNAVVDGAFTSTEQLDSGVLAVAHAAGQQITELSFAKNRVAAVGPEYVVTSVRLSAQNWTGAVRVVGTNLDVYRLTDAGAEIVSRGVVVLDSPPIDTVEPSTESILTIAVRRESLADVLRAAHDETLWLVGQ